MYAIGGAYTATVSGYDPATNAWAAAPSLGTARFGLAAAILNGTLAAAMGLGLQQWIAGLLLWLAGHSLAVFAAKRDPDFAPVLARHLRQKAGYKSLQRVLFELLI